MKKYLKILLIGSLLVIFNPPLRVGGELKTTEPVLFNPIKAIPLPVAKPVVVESVVKPIVNQKSNKEISSSTEKIVFTNYYVNDSTNSKNMTSAGYTTNDFQINGNGWYTYKGKVVLAAATTVCLRVKTGACGKYNTVPKGLEVYDLKEEIIIIVAGKSYHAIVLDSCGACMYYNKSDNGLQRYDIFVAGSKYAFGKIVGELQK